VLVEVNAENLAVAVILFDPADRAAASTELFERHAQSGADGALSAARTT